jgi:serine protease Do
VIPIQTTMTPIKFFSIPLLGTIATLVVMPPTFALNPEQIDAFASQTTVLIARNLKEGDIEAKREFDPGSGVIISHNGNTYYALTNLHVAEHEDWYGIRTADGEVHPVNNIDSPQTIHRFGIFQGSLGDSYRPIKGFDLALIKFESEHNYPVATIGNPDLLKPGDAIFVSGWPNPEDTNARRQRISSSGLMSISVNTPSPDGGYSVLYNSPTQRGMSGGPVFNINGEVVGIHGRGRRREEIYCVDAQLNIDNSCGIKSTDFINQAEYAQLNMTLNHNPPSRKDIILGMVNKDNADVIDDIYSMFTELDKLKENVGNLEKRMNDLEEKRRKSSNSF